MYKHFLKRVFDFFIAMLALLILSPVFLIVIVLLSFANKGAGVFFTQRRPGLHGKIFKVIKFKSMTDEKDENGVLLPNDQRITKVGKIIRKFSIDELPQLINILKGDMALIGPRPLLVRYLELYTPDQARRHEVRPGLTGWAQVHGRKQVEWHKRIELNIWYVEHVSFLLDLKILFMTVFKVFPDGALQFPVVRHFLRTDQHRFLRTEHLRPQHVFNGSVVVKLNIRFHAVFPLFSSGSDRC